MKFTQLILLIAMVLVRSVVLAQNPEPPKFTKGINDVPDGERIVSNLFFDEHHVGMATENGIYLFDRDLSVGLLDPPGELLFRAPNGLTIASVTEMCNTDDFLITFTNGSVMLMKQLGLNEFKYIPLKGIPIPGSGSAKECKGDALYAITTSALYISRDTARTWALDTTGLGSYPLLYHVELDSTQNVYLTSNRGLYRQHPDSNIWRKTNGPSNYGATGIFIDKDDHIWVSFGGNGVRMSTDYGVTWTLDTLGMGAFQANAFARDAYGNMYAMGSNQLFRRDHSTGVWARIDTPLSDGFADRSAGWFTAISADSAILLGTFYGLFVSADGGASWHAAVRTPSQHLAGLRQLPGGGKAISTGLGIFTHGPGESQWTRRFPSNGPAKTGELIADGSGNLFTDFGVGSIYHMWWRSSDGGETWNADTAGISGTKLDVSMSVIDPEGGIHAATRSGASPLTSLAYYKPSNGPWQIDTIGFPPTDGSQNEGLGFDSAGYVYVSGRYKTGSVWNAAPIMRKPVSGGAWTPDSAGYAFHGMIPNQFFPVGKNRIIGVRYGSMILRDTNGVWRVFNPPISGFGAGNVITSDADGRVYCAVTGINAQGQSFGRGVFVSSDLGATWIKIGLDSVVVNGFAQGTDTIFVYTQNGLYGIVPPSPVSTLSTEVSVDSSWNLVSVPFTRDDNSANALFPTRLSGSTYEYGKSYISRDSLKPGKGYWTKFPGAASQTVTGYPLASVAVDVDSGWNIIGSVDHAASIPSSALITSNVYGYSHGYQTAATLVPGKGYWVKTNGSGSLQLGAGAAKAQPLRLDELNSLTFSDGAGNAQTLYFGAFRPVELSRYELPPPPPAGMFDARFATQRMVALSDAETASKIPIDIRDASNAVAVRWSVNSSSGDAYRTAALVINGTPVRLNRNGSLPLRRGSVIELELPPARANAAVPALFALEQNFPNPFNPSTTIRFSLPQRMAVTLVMYDVLGRRVAAPLSARLLEAGYHEMNFDGTNLASGVYYYKLNGVPSNGSSDAVTLVRTMNLVK